MTCRKDEGHMARMGKERSENQGEESKNQSLWFLLDLCAYFVDTVTPKV
jgi:hypothetical protein